MTNQRVTELFEQLKRRRVIRVATLYVVVFWPIIQIVDIISPALNLSDNVMAYLVISFSAGLPVVAILSWFVDINQDSSTGDDGAEGRYFSSRKEVIIIGCLAVLVTGLFFVQVYLNDDTLEQLHSAPTLATQPAVTPTTTPSTGGQPTDQSIAVLPFITFSEVSEDEFFADGLTEEMLNVLARNPGLRVAARTSSFAYKGVNKNVQLIGQELGVSMILEGSVRRNNSNNTVRVTAQLIDVQSGAHIWSETYDHEFNDIFKIQDEIARAVADKLQLQVMPGQNQQLKASANPEALIAYGMGQQDLGKRTEQSLHDAVRFFEKAISADPSYALAYSGLADAYSLLVSYRFEKSEDLLPRAEEAVNKALELDDSLGVAWASKALYYMQIPEKKDEIKPLLEKALKLNPSYAMAQMWYAGEFEDPEERLKHYRKAVELDPRSPVAAFNVANTLLTMGRESEALEMFGRIIDSDPYFGKAYALVGSINERRGRLGQAISNYERAYELRGADPQMAVWIAKLYSDIGDFEAADEWFARLDGAVPSEYVDRVEWLEIGRYAAAGDETEANKRLTVLREGPLETREDYGDHLMASYYLKDYLSIIDLYERRLIGSVNEGENDDYRLEQNIDSAIAAAYAYGLGLDGNPGYLQKQLEAIGEAEKLIQEYSDRSRLAQPTIWYYRSQTALLKGEQQQALAYLQRAVDEGWREHWRPEFEPVMSTLLVQKPFQTMMAALETRMNIMRDQFAFAADFN